MVDALMLLVENCQMHLGCLTCTETSTNGVMSIPGVLDRRLANRKHPCEVEVGRMMLVGVVRSTLFIFPFNLPISRRWLPSRPGTLGSNVHFRFPLYWVCCPSWEIKTDARWRRLLQQL